MYIVMDAILRKWLLIHPLSTTRVLTLDGMGTATFDTSPCIATHKAMVQYIFPSEIRVICETPNANSA